jgi:hypothetical protein
MDLLELKELRELKTIALLWISTTEAKPFHGESFVFNSFNSLNSFNSITHIKNITIYEDRRSSKISE